MDVGMQGGTMMVTKAVQDSDASRSLSFLTQAAQHLNGSAHDGNIVDDDASAAATAAVVAAAASSTLLVAGAAAAAVAAAEAAEAAEAAKTASGNPQPMEVDGTAASAPPSLADSTAPGADVAKMVSDVGSSISAGPEPEKPEKLESAVGAGGPSLLSSDGASLVLG